MSVASISEMRIVCPDRGQCIATSTKEMSHHLLQNTKEMVITNIPTLFFRIKHRSVVFLRIHNNLSVHSCKKHHLHQTNHDACHHSFRTLPRSQTLSWEHQLLHYGNHEQGQVVSFNRILPQIDQSRNNLVLPTLQLHHHVSWGTHNRFHWSM